MTSSLNTIPNWGVYKKKEKKTIRRRLQKAIQTLRSKLATLRSRKISSKQKKTLTRRIRNTLRQAKSNLATLRKPKEYTINYAKLYPNMMVGPRGYTQPKPTFHQRVSRTIQKTKNYFPTLKKKQPVIYYYNLY